MTFDPAQPVQSDNLSVSQPKLLTNNQQLNTKFGINHVALTDTSTDQGKHKYVALVEQDDDPASLEDEYILYAKEQNGATEIFARPESNATPYQITKDGALYTGLRAAAAVNFDSTPTIQGSSLNIASVASGAGTGEFRITFTTPITSNNYFWDISGFGATAGEAIASQVLNSATYGDVVSINYIDVAFKKASGAGVAITRASVMIWEYQ